MQRFFEIFSDGPYKDLDQLFDATLHSEDGVTFQVHRMQLAVKNIYFKTMYCSNFSDSTDVLLKGIDGETLGQVLFYLYTNKAVLNHENVMDLWIASDYFLADSLKEMCRDFVFQALDEDNCLGVFLTVWNIEGLGLVEECFRYLVVHFRDAMLDCSPDCRNSSERTSVDIWKDLPFEAVKKVLESKNLDVLDERKVWDVILTWLEKDNSNKHQHIPELLKCMYADDLDELLATEIHEVVRNHFSLNIKSGISHNLFENFACGSRAPNNLNFVAHHNMSNGSNFYLDLYLTFDDKLDVWRKLETNLTLCPDFLVQIGYNVYMIDAWENRTIVFNLLDCSRSSMPPLAVDRSRYCVVSVLDHIYVLGGAMVDFGDTDTIERFDPVANEWHTVPQMHPMILTDAVAMNNCIYAIGDIGEELDSMMVQVFNPMTDEWHVVEAPEHFRQEFTAVVYKGKLYVIGGEDQDSRLRTAEEYNPEADTWTLHSELPFAYVLPKAIVLGGLLVVYENDGYGYNRQLGRISHPVLFDEETEKWVVIDESSPLFNIHLYQFCNISQPDIVKGLVRKNRRPDVEWVNSYLA
ncbi:hypothetical protein JTE90_003891 [Oedothorax gibbosus]|uniref:BTB domain-containing protein n=1 Tax=Oedothorax gibbosus TaxID=931172 RepID=A0AAV6UH54_9ARAC|nr:hypothetical protein JTE90_003891 [Oedothorax gibbosus]